MRERVDRMENSSVIWEPIDLVVPSADVADREQVDEWPMAELVHGDGSAAQDVPQRSHRSE